MLDPTLKLGHGQLDEDHNQIMSLIEDLDEATTANRLVVLEHLIKYATDHCALEERLMRAADYPLTDAHMLLHVELQNVIMSQFHALAGEHPDGEAIEKIRECLRTHILTVDKAFTDYLARHPNFAPPG